MNRRAMMAMGGAGVLGLAVIGVVAHDAHEAPAAAPFDLDSPRRPSELTMKYMDLQTAEVDFGTVQEVIRLTGSVRAMPERVRIVGSAVAGTLQKLEVRVGDRVVAGQVIGVVRSPELARLVSEQIKTEVELEHAVAEVATTRSNMAQLEAQIRATRTQAELAEDEAKRLQAGGETVGANVLAQKQGAAVAARMQVTTLDISLQQAQKTLESLKRVESATARQIEAIKASIEIVHDHPPGVDEAAERASEGETGGVFNLYAPIGGVVTKREGIQGQGVEPGQTIVEIADYSEVMIEGELPESLIGKLGTARGQEVRIRRPGGGGTGELIATGEVRGIAPVVDSVKRTAHLIISAKNAFGEGGDDAIPKLKDGMFVSLGVVVCEAKDAVVVPSSALVSDGPMQFVFVKEQDAYVKRDVVPGYRDDRVVEIVEGLVPGDVVVTRGAYLLTQLRPKGEAGQGHDHGHDHGHSH